VHERAGGSVGEASVARRRCHNDRSNKSAIGYNFRLRTRDSLIAMEAERINQIAASLERLSARTADLRRYL
jgi:hypothetical protein